MAYETITATPKLEDFTALEEHQEQTPQTFFGAKPVLHLQSPNAKVSISKGDLEGKADFAGLGDAVDRGEDCDFSNVGVWVSSRHLTLYSSAKQHGVQIPYPTITIHAQEGNAVLLELNLSDQNTADEDLEFLQLRIFPTSISKAASEQADDIQTNGNGSPSPIKALYDAISACQELNPDPNPEGDEDEEGGFDETAPGATGWITSENMADFMDENGNIRMPEGGTVIGGEEEVYDGYGNADGLGAGAGRRRGADEVDAGDGAKEDETKWQRTG